MGWFSKEEPRKNRVVVLASAEERDITWVLADVAEFEHLEIAEFGPLLGPWYEWTTVRGRKFTVTDELSNRILEILVKHTGAVKIENSGESSWMVSVTKKDGTVIAGRADEVRMAIALVYIYCMTNSWTATVPVFKGIPDYRKNR